MPSPSRPPSSPLRIAVIGAGPVGLALALHAAQRLPDAAVTVFDQRPETQDVAADARTLALSLGSVQMLERLGVWPDVAAAATGIHGVHVSQQAPAVWPTLLGLAAEPSVRITAEELRVPQLGAVASYGALVAPLQARWFEAVAREPQRLAARFSTPVAALKAVDGGVEVDAGIAERFDLAVVAEGGVFAGQVRKALHRDYGQTAWVGQVTLAQPHRGWAYERFTLHGPAALLPLPSRDGLHRAALVWCVDTDDDPVRALDDRQRPRLLEELFPREVGPITSMTPLKPFALGLNAEPTLVEGATVRIGNAAQTLHPVAGQGLNLGLRDAHALVAALSTALSTTRGTAVTAGPAAAAAEAAATESSADTHAALVRQALRRVEWQRAPDRWALIAATDFLARSFTWQLPGASTARGLGLAALQAFGPGRALLARRMMFGLRS